MTVYDTDVQCTGDFAGVNQHDFNVQIVTNLEAFGTVFGNATGVGYNHATSGLTAGSVQAAIDELVSKLHAAGVSGF